MRRMISADGCPRLVLHKFPVISALALIKIIRPRHLDSWSPNRPVAESAHGISLRQK